MPSASCRASPGWTCYHTSTSVHRLGRGVYRRWLAAWVKRDKSLANVERQLKPSRAEQAKAERQWLDDERRFIPIQTQAPANDLPAPAFIAAGRRVDEEPEPINHIRSYSNYLAPTPGLGSADTWSLVAIYLRNLLINSLTILPATVILVVLVRLVVWFFAQGPSNSRWLLGFSVLVAFFFLFAAVGFIVLVLGEVYHPREAVSAWNGQGSDPAPPTRFTKKWLHILVVLPLFITAVLFTWVFGVSLLGFRLQVETIQQIYALIPTLHVLLWLSLGVVVVGVIGLVWFWMQHRRSSQWRERPLFDRGSALLISFGIGLVGAMMFAVPAIYFLASPKLGINGWFSQEVLWALTLASATAVLVGVAPFVAYFPHVVRVLFGWQGDWSHGDRLAYVTRLAVVPLLAGFTGGLISSWPHSRCQIGPGINRGKSRRWPAAVHRGRRCRGHHQRGFARPVLEGGRREWWASLTGLLIQYTLAWLAFFAILLYGNYGVITLVAKRKWVLAALPTAWALITRPAPWRATTSSPANRRAASGWRSRNPPLPPSPLPSS